MLDLVTTQEDAASPLLSALNSGLTSPQLEGAGIASSMKEIPTSELEPTQIDISDSKHTQ